MAASRSRRLSRWLNGPEIEICPRVSPCSERIDWVGPVVGVFRCSHPQLRGGMVLHFAVLAIPPRLFNAEEAQRATQRGTQHEEATQPTRGKAAPSGRTQAGGWVQTRIGDRRRTGAISHLL